ncbi:MAG: hypothetical protein P8L66_12755 [Rhodospirillaceae bacterium]|nr:hypothetical protein [Rhodospirillaceae bacterium]
MTAKSKSEILDGLQAFMGSHGGNHKEWCVSNSSNPKMDLTKCHKINSGDKGLFRKTESDIRSA